MMAMGRLALLAVGAGMLAACAAEPPPAPADRYRCVVIPNDLVECTVLEDAGPPAGE
jgi:hypothetical protein